MSSSCPLSLPRAEECDQRAHIGSIGLDLYMVDRQPPKRTPELAFILGYEVFELFAHGAVSRIEDHTRVGLGIYELQVSYIG